MLVSCVRGSRGLLRVGTSRMSSNMGHCCPYASMSSFHDMTNDGGMYGVAVTSTVSPAI